MTEPEIDKWTASFEPYLVARFKPTTAYQYLMGIRSLLRVATEATPEGIRAAETLLPLGARARSGPAVRAFLLHIGGTAPDVSTQQLVESMAALVASTSTAKQKKPALPRDAAQAVVDIAKILDTSMRRQSTMWYTTLGSTAFTRNRDLRFLAWTTNKLNPKRADGFDAIAISTWENIRRVDAKGQTTPEGQIVIFDVVQYGGPLDDLRNALQALIAYGGWSLEATGNRPLVPKVPRAQDAFNARELRKAVAMALRD